MDHYDEAIEYLNRHPEQLDEIEEDPGSHHIAGVLFVNAGTNLYSYLKQPNGKWLGNPLRIKQWPEHFVAQEQYVTEMILKDQRLPTVAKECRLEHLPVLAEYQRKFDRFWNRKFKNLIVVEDKPTNTEPRDVQLELFPEEPVADEPTEIPLVPADETAVIETCSSFGADPDLKPGPLTQDDRGWTPDQG